MSQFEDRERAFEAKFAKEREAEFRAVARRNKLLGLWAAELMRLKGEEANAYALSLVKADVEKSGDEDVIQKLRRDFDAMGVAISDHQISREMQSLLEVARSQVRFQS
jgi:hypothetical protein